MYDFSYHKPGSVADAAAAMHKRAHAVTACMVGERARRTREACGDACELCRAGFREWCDPCVQEAGVRFVADQCGVWVCWVWSVRGGVVCSGGPPRAFYTRGRRSSAIYSGEAPQMMMPLAIASAWKLRK